LSLFPQHRGIPKRIISGQPFNSSANQTHNFTVPQGKLWQIVTVSVKRTDSTTVSVNLYNSEGVKITQLLSGAAGVSEIAGPENAADTCAKPIMAMEDDYIQFYFGTAQTSLTSQVQINIIEFDLKEIFGE